ncbi:hypothetical protein DFR48_108123 [Ciceribacter lividus]|uniref:Uncharacterized protein n=2 Tax=Ciceribacter lividus TaxID=1197950 RepID=A0A6I7HL31_9HYPH|nr:hypothetical protein DFR48_108123 [Ciceribacter lividus]
MKAMKEPVEEISATRAMLVILAGPILWTGHFAFAYATPAPPECWPSLSLTGVLWTGWAALTLETCTQLR